MAIEIIVGSGDPLVAEDMLATLQATVITTDVNFQDSPGIIYVPNVEALIREVKNAPNPEHTIVLLSNDYAKDPKVTAAMLDQTGMTLHAGSLKSRRRLMFLGH